ncbi:mckusick-kaufman/Bardet-Biedl syndromes putative chaperonin [Plakobranchus ocellatus]|uniref:Mckusick-kaufman/Bardet-Biedl syndromes putative chaperonin n=1 Tax=Plakobranchus ocellatus TaxID=259542 RepID=A0AAV4BS39_9GAST|nr:mckusick-kaufman/Bardet-Biedl syndromes putative chaperonin [Plakobranchus ocellatus]
MFHLEKNKPVSSQIKVASVDSPDNLSSISAFLDLVGSCSGPDGGIHMIRNPCGGHVTMTTDSSRLLASMCLSRQILKLVMNSVQGHLKEFGDGGKYLAFACLSLIKLTIQETGKSTHHRAYSALNEQFVKLVSEYLNSEECAVCVNADLTDMHVLFAYTRSVISTRPLLHLSERDFEQISQLIVKCFVESIPEQENNDSGPGHSNRIFIVGSPLEHPRSSRLLKGLLLECPELPIVKGEHAFSIMKTNQRSKDFLSEGDSSKCIKVALVTCSMSGDLEDIVSATFEVSEGQAATAENLVLDKWAEFCIRLAHYQVGLLLCQKVIHPRLKILLKTQNIMAVDRLGSNVVPYVQDLTGAQPIVSVIAVTNPESLCGYITAAEHMLLNDKSYLLLKQPKASLVTLILCSKTEESLEEFKCCVKVSLRGLFSLLREEKLLAGAGCWQIHCSYVLNEQVRSSLSTLADGAGCSEAQVLSALSVFRSAVFHRWVQLLQKGDSIIEDSWDKLMIDSKTKHCWKTPSGCKKAGSMEEQLFCCCGLNTSSLTSISLTNGASFVMFNPSRDSSARGQVFPNHCRNGDKRESSAFDALLSDSEPGATGTAESQLCLNQPVTITATLDHFSAAIQGLYKAVFTANLVLSLGQVISDVD